MVCLLQKEQQTMGTIWIYREISHAMAALSHAAARVLFMVLVLSIEYSMLYLLSWSSYVQDLNLGFRLDFHSVEVYIDCIKKYNVAMTTSTDSSP
jgi:hypothetical protein